MRKLARKKDFRERREKISRTRERDNDRRRKRRLSDLHKLPRHKDRCSERRDYGLRKLARNQDRCQDQQETDLRKLAYNTDRRQEQRPCDSRKPARKNTRRSELVRNNDCCTASSRATTRSELQQPLASLPALCNYDSSDGSARTTAQHPSSASELSATLQKLINELVRNTMKSLQQKLDKCFCTQEMRVQQLMDEYFCKQEMHNTPYTAEAKALAVDTKHEDTTVPQQSILRGSPRLCNNQDVLS